MTKSKASLKGKGVDILLGGGTGAESGAAPSPESAPAQPSTEAAAPPAPPVQPSAETEAVTTPAPNPFAEPAPAAPAGPNPFAEPEPSSTSDFYSEPAAFTDTVALPVAETAVGPAVAAPEGDLGMEAASGQPPEPVALSLPTESAPAWGADEPVPIPAAFPAEELAPAASGPVSVALPSDPTLVKRPQFGGLIMTMQPIPNPESFEPTTELTQTGLQVATVGRTRMTASEEEVLRRVGAERMQNLSKRIDELYTSISSGAISDAGQAGEALLYLRRARDKELEEQRQFDEAEYLVNVAQYLLSRSANVRSASRRYGPFILLYGLLWLVLYATALIVDRLGYLALALNVASAPGLQAATSMDAVFPAFTAVMWGGIGGVLGLLYSLFKHIAVRQDFDGQFLVWYLVQPFMGMLMGAIVFLFFGAGIFQLIGADGPAFLAITNLLAVAAAFRQHYVYAWLEAVLKNFQPGGKTEEQKLPEASSGTGQTGVG